MVPYQPVFSNLYELVLQTKISLRTKIINKSL